MGWFDEQIKQRMLNDDNAFAAAFAEMASVVTGRDHFEAAFADETKRTADAVQQILNYYRVPSQELPGSVKGLNDILEYLLRPSGIMRRTVELSGSWYRDGQGALLCVEDSGTVTALIPGRLSGYSYYDQDLGKRVRVTKKNAARFQGEAICFYKPFPLRAMTVRDLLEYMFRSVSGADYLLFAAAALGVSLVGMLTAYVNNIMFSTVLNGGGRDLLIAAAALLLSVTLSGTLLGMVKGLLLSAIQTKLRVAVEAAAMMRVLSLPADFFKQYSAGELASRTGYMNYLCSLLLDITLSSGLSALFSLVYVFQIFHYSPALALPAMGVILATSACVVLGAVAQTRRSTRLQEAAAKESGLVFSLFSGIQKIKVAGAEKRAFAKWAGLYSPVLKEKYHPILTVAFSAFIGTLGSAVIYWLAVRTGVSMGEYMAFNVAYGMVFGAFMQLASISMELADLKPTLKMVEPILEAVPEIALGKKVVTRLSGAIELNNVSFRYSESMPMVIDNLSLKIRSGQYVAIVGTTGCGKSTLMRLMLGFERPQKGAVYYDGKDLETLDLKSLRRNIGTVMQDGKLFQGNIYSNITISAPWLSLEEAWQAAEMSGIAEDIRRMPMQMHTVISEGSGGISGGQRQRLLIARAVAPKPRILMFDEATSALDNITQKQVSDALEGLRCTRIVIAHRLSTIRQCDRILVLDKGRIIEDGTYEQLMARGGFFSELVARQRIDGETNEST